MKMAKWIDTQIRSAKQDETNGNTLNETIYERGDDGTISLVGGKRVE